MCSRSTEPRWRAVPGGYAALVLLLVLTACDREERRFREVPPGATADAVVRQSPLQPGPPVRQARRWNAYEANAYAVSEGKRLFNQFNCVGCHAHGGGSIGPPLMDGEWIYGSEPENIAASIVEGRPNGMPAFGGKIVTAQVWQLAAYVRSMSGLVRKDVAPGRDDALQATAQEQATTERRPVESSRPPGSVQP
jgi:cytochrome c oxidase cbb3-type subunit III